MERRPGSKRDTEVWAVDGARAQRRADQVVTEEPMEIRLAAGRQRRTVAITMAGSSSGIQWPLEGERM